jgi:hypothetical protein
VVYAADAKNAAAARAIASLEVNSPQGPIDLQSAIGNPKSGI